MRKVAWLAGVIAVILAVGLMRPAGATPISANTCAELEKEKTSLETAGVQTDMQLKLDEAKALAADRLKRIQRYVEVSGSVLFRCSTTATAVQAPVAGSTKQLPAGAAAAKIAKTEPVKAPAVAKPAPSKPQALRAKKR